MSERNMRNECYKCTYKRSVPGNAHIACNKPDPDMTGKISKWFIYPVLFDPVWKTKDCVHYEEDLPEDHYLDQKFEDDIMYGSQYDELC